jgi:wyosine [tRNA(Phe)-imidazoG37] synthetase (radical SAM superfamily)
MLRQISLQDSVVYGPVRSRRLGSSLGINVLPLSYKLCSSNCVYCQYGWTVPEHPHEPINPSTSLRVDPEPFDLRSGLSTEQGRSAEQVERVERIKRAPELLAAVEEAFQELIEQRTPVDCITLAGNGEPTLHPDIEELVGGIKQLRDRYFPIAKVGILSDATQLHRPSVFRALQQLDVRYMKLDAGDEATWRRINEPLGRADWQTMISDLKRLPDVVLQCMFIQGSYDNTSDEHIERWVELVSAIRPLSVQVYTVDRAPADPGIVKVPQERLEEIAALLTTRTGIPAEVYD